MRLIIFAILSFLLYYLIKGIFRSRKKIDERETRGVIDEMVRDPFCKIYVPKKDSIKHVIGGKEHFFCSRECAHKYESEHRS